MKLLAVIGDPIAHSKSPLIHSLFSRETGVGVSYEAIRVTESELQQFIPEFFSQNGSGLNVTVPHKQAAYGLCKTLTSRARLAEAVNTLWLENGELQGDNTDGIGMVRDIQDNNGIPIEGLNILVLGAGGAVRGILGPLLDCHPGAVHIANRTEKKADELAVRFSSLGDLSSSNFDEIPGKSYDLIINGTSAGLNDEVPPISASLVTPITVCYDMLYGPGGTTFTRWGRQGGAKHTLDGLGMLVEQAAESFFIWTGHRPQTRRVIDMLRTGGN